MVLALLLVAVGALAAKTPSRKPAYQQPKPTYQAYHYPSPVYQQTAKPPHVYKTEPEIPACSANTTKSWCLEDSEYPKHDVAYALNHHFQAVLALYKDVDVNTKNSVETLNHIKQETYLCPSTISYVQPLRAVNVDGKWRVIANKLVSYDYKFEQSARVEECDVDAVGQSCPLVADCYESKCVQKSIYHRFLVFDPYEYYFPFAIEKFKLPASCACFVGSSLGH